MKVQMKILKKIQPKFHLQILKRDLLMVTNMAEKRYVRIPKMFFTNMLKAAFNDSIILNA